MKTQVFAILSILIIAMASCSIPIKLFSNKYTTYSNVHFDKVLKIVHQSIDLDVPTYKEAKVQIIVDTARIPQYIIVYIMSNVSYSLVTKQIEIDAHYNVLAVNQDYELTTMDYEQQPHANELVCPDADVQFVSATPVPEYPTAKNAVDKVFAQAQEQGYKAVQLLGDEASVENYENWLSCPKLVAFFNVGHGYNQGISLADGTLSYTVFKTLLKGAFNQEALILFNSCEVNNEPLKSAVAVDANAKKFIGGVTTLLIGPSELASLCFWEGAFNNEPMTETLKACNKQFDKGDIFGIAGNGIDFFRNQTFAAAELQFLQ